MSGTSCHDNCFIVLDSANWTVFVLLLGGVMEGVTLNDLSKHNIIFINAVSLFSEFEYYMR